MESQIIRDLPTPELIAQCAEQNLHYSKKETTDPRYCYELLRRGLAEGEKQAWEQAVVIWEPQIASWIRRDGRWRSTGEEPEHFVTETVLKVTKYLGGKRFQNFHNLASILAYMRRIATSTVIDFLRKKKRHEMHLASSDALIFLANRPTPEDIVFSYEFTNELWQVISTLLKNCLEECVVRLFFREGRKPREIFKLYKQFCSDLCGEDQLDFRDVAHIQRVKDNLMERLRNHENRMNLTQLVQRHAGIS